MRRFHQAFLVLLLITFHPPGLAEDRAVSSLGRIEPHNGIIRVAAPSGGVLEQIGAGSVIKSLLVKVGDWVEQDQIIAYLDSYNLRQTEVARLTAINTNAESELSRQKNLDRTFANSKVNLDQATMTLDVARADLAAARARLELSIVRAPLRAQVLEINAGPGEIVGPDGIVDLGQTDRMYVVAEVYETDISLVKKGQAATIRAPAIDGELSGKVERVSLKVSRLDVLGDDPVSRTDARVVEVYILLDDSAAVATYTNMQVELEIRI